MVYDHFLARDPQAFPSAADLAAFARRTYEQLTTREAFFPDRFSRFFPYMRDQDWFSGYRAKQGIFASFGGLARRAATCPIPGRPAAFLKGITPNWEDCYRAFFPRIEGFCAPDPGAALTVEGTRENGGNRGKLDEPGE